MTNGSSYHNALAFAILSLLLPSYIYADLSTFQQCYYQGDIWSIYSTAGGLGGLPPRRCIVSIALCSCSSVDLSTCLTGLTGQEVNILYQGIIGKPEINIGVQGIMGTSYLFTCRPVYQG